MRGKDEIRGRIEDDFNIPNNKDQQYKYEGLLNELRDPLEAWESREVIKRSEKASEILMCRNELQTVIDDYE